MVKVLACYLKAVKILLFLSYLVGSEFGMLGIICVNNSDSFTHPSHEK